MTELNKSHSEYYEHDYLPETENVFTDWNSYPGEETFLPWDSEMAGYFEKNVAQGMSGKVKPGGHCDLGQCAPPSS